MNKGNQSGGINEAYADITGTGVLYLHTGVLYLLTISTAFQVLLLQVLASNLLCVLVYINLV